MNLFSLHKNDTRITRVSSNATVLPNRYSFRLVRRERVVPTGMPVPMQPVSVPVAQSEEPTIAPVRTVVRATKTEKTTVDTDKRGFLKLAGVLGLGALAASALPEKAQAYVMGSAPTSGVVGLRDSTNTRIDPAREGGNLASVKTNTDPLVASGAGAYIRQDSNATIARESGGNLATIAGKDFATEATLAAIKTQTDKFTFSGSNLLTAGGSGGGATTLEDTTGTQINPATDDSIVYLRRMVKLMESQATVDGANRQRMTLDALPTIALTNTVPVSGTVTATVASTAVTNVTALAGQNQQMFQDVARNTYANGVRQNLVFS